MYRNKMKYVLALALCAGLLSAISGTASAQVLDLTGAGSSGVINDAQFMQGLYDNDPAGTGVLLPFLWISPRGNETTERGYNTDGDFEFDQRTPWTSSLLLDAIELHTIGTTQYREFLLDANEAGSANTRNITLNSLQIFMGNAGNLTGYPGGLGDMIWDMDAKEDWSVVINAQGLEPGSGQSDISVFIPNSLFTGGEYVYLYSEFSNADSGYEEWAVHDRQGVQAVPEPVTMLGFATPLGLLALGKIRQRFSR